MVRSAATLLRARGVHGVGLREIVAHSGGPRGSLGRFFPGGKTQLMTEALDLKAERALHDLLVELAGAKLMRSAHDCSDAGLAVTLATMTA